jgi:hypothetical protein
MTGTRFAKSETREFAERDRMDMPSFRAPSSTDAPDPWHTTNGAFIVALVAAGVLLALLALALR